MCKINAVGVSALNGRYKVRFSTDIAHVKRLIKSGNTDVELISLPHTMNKSAAVAFLRNTDVYTRMPEYAEAIDDAVIKHVV